MTIYYPQSYSDDVCTDTHENTCKILSSYMDFLNVGRFRSFIIQVMCLSNVKLVG